MSLWLLMQCRCSCVCRKRAQGAQSAEKQALKRIVSTTRLYTDCSPKNSSLARRGKPHARQKQKLRFVCLCTHPPPTPFTHPAQLPLPRRLQAHPAQPQV